jgi:hypothetical protein
MEPGDMVIAFPKEWLKKKTVPELIRLREEFTKEHGECKCTCDWCCDALYCALAYDGYNTGGDCLLEK